MFYSIATEHCVLKINPTVLENLVSYLYLLDNDGAFDTIQTMNQKVIPAIEAMETKPFGFTDEFKEAMILQFNKLNEGDKYAIVNDYLTAKCPISTFWWEYLKQINQGTPKATAKELADKAHKDAHEKQSAENEIKVG